MKKALNYKHEILNKDEEMEEERISSFRIYDL